MKKILSMLVMVCILASMIILPASAADATLNVTYAANGVFNVTGTIEGDGSYKLIMADYDAEGTFLGATTEELTVADGAFATTVDFSANDKQLVSTKLMVWDMTTATPVAEAVVNPKANGGVNIATADKAVVGGTGSANAGLLGTPESILDGDDATWAGFYATRGTTGYIYLDLKNYYEIDRIEVLSYSDNATLENAGARGTEYDIVLGNNVPDGTAFDAENPNGEVKVAYVEFDEAAKDKNVGYKTFYVPENAGEFRYVSLEKWDPERAGLCVAGVKVYVSEDAASNDIENVALGKSAAENVMLAGTTESSYSNGLATVTDGKMFAENKQQFISGGRGIYQLDLGSYYDVEKVMVDAVGDVYSSNVTVYLASEPYSATTGFPKEKTTIIEGADAWGTASKFVALETPVNARYIMFWKSDSAFRLGEIEVWGKENIPATNVALGKGATGSTSSRPFYSGYDDFSVITDGAVCVGGNSKQAFSYLGAWYCLDLGSYYDVEKLMLDCITNDYTSQVNVYLSKFPADASTGLPAEKTTIIDGTANTAAWGAATKTVVLDEVVNARYIIVQRPSGATGGRLSLGEIEVWGKENVPVTNVALGKSTTANVTHSPALSGYSNDIACATDGKLCVGGNSQQIILAASPGWYCLDLGKEYDVEKIMVDCVTKDFTSNVSVYLSNEPAVDGVLPANKTVILDGEANADSWGVATKTVELENAVKGRYVIVRRGGGQVGNGFRLGEIEVWGK